jgi:predicted nucleic acid-binding protein
MSGTSAASPPLRAILLDSGPLSLASNPRPTTESDACSRWLEDHVLGGVQVIVPEIVDYEIRRELLRADKPAGIAGLEMLTDTLTYLPLTTDMLRQAAAFWAKARRAGRTTADPHALDGDAILAAQALSLGYAPGEFVVATTNIGHLSQFVPAKLWQDIS